jgi:hypothetical protein
MNHFVSSSDFMGFERNPMKSYRELDKPRLTSRYIRLRRHSKWHWQNTLSVRVISLDSKEILWNRIENSTTPSYFSIHFACFFKTNKTLEVTLKQHFVSSSDGEATAEALYRELDLTHLTSRYISLVFSKQTKHSKWQAPITLSVRVISLDSKEIPWNRIENSTSPNYFSIQFSIENHLPTKERRQARSDRARTRKSQHINL